MEQYVSWQTIISRTLSSVEGTASSRFLQLATLDEHGLPSCRTLVFRGFNQDKSQLYLHTDNRSDKAHQLAINDHVEACWYFTETREQFRFKGIIECIGHSAPDDNTTPSLPSMATTHQQALRHTHWQHLSVTQRQGYGENGNSRTPSLNFVLMLLHIHQVDYLRLEPLPHLHIIYRPDAEQSWQGEPAPL